MNLLALDTSTETMSAAIQVNGQLFQHESPGGALASTTVLPTLQALLQQAGISLQAIDVLVVGCGPGSCTGVAVASSVIPGLA